MTLVRRALENIKTSYDTNNNRWDEGEEEQTLQYACVTQADASRRRSEYNSRGASVCVCVLYVL